MSKPWYSEEKQGWFMESKMVYLFTCPNCGKEYIYPVGITTRYCTECNPPEEEKK